MIGLVDYKVVEGKTFSFVVRMNHWILNYMTSFVKLIWFYWNEHESVEEWLKSSESESDRGMLL